MPTSLIIAAAGAWVASSAVVIAAIGTFGAALAGAAVSIAVSAIFAKKQQQDFGASAQGTQTTVRQAVAPWQWIYGETRVGGAITFVATTNEGNTANQILHLVITLTGHSCEAIDTVYFDDVPLTLDAAGIVKSAPYKDYAQVWKSLGDEDGQPFPDLVAASNGLWTDAHRQSGRAKLYVRLSWNQDIYTNGIPNVSAVVRGRKVYDPRSGLTAWTDNAALCISDWLANTDIGLGCNYATEIDELQLVAAANVCDEEVSLAAGGTEKRYTVNGVLRADAAPRDTLGRLLTAMNGTARFIGGVWKLYPAAYRTPEAEALVADDLRGPLHILPRVSRRDLCNRVKGLYVSPNNFWQPTDFPPVTNATYLSEDQGEEIWRELDLPYTNSAAMAQRIAKIELERVRQQIVIEWPGKMSCYRLQPGDTVPVTLDRYGWNEKIFEVVTSQLIFEEQGDDGGVIIGCDLVLRETAAAVYDWNSGEETTIDPAPDTNLPDPFNVGIPGRPEISESLVETRQGRGIAAKATANWTVSADAFVSAYQFEYRVVGSAEWVVLPTQRGTSLDIFDIAPGRYDFRVKAFNVLGVSSAYSSTLDKEILGLGAKPADPVILGLQIAGGLAYMSLEPHPDLDVRRGGRWRVRFVHEGAAIAWDAAFSIGEPDTYMGDQTNLVLPLKPGAYLVRAEDSSGNQSAGYDYIETKQASVLTWTAVSTVQEDTAFAGTHSGTTASLGILTLGGTGLVDDAADWDSIADVDQLGGSATSGTYTFAASHDFGAVSKRRLTSRIEGSIVNANDLIDDRGDPIDNWLDMDGNTESSGGAADIYVEARETDDDPTGTPTWSAWKRIDSTEVEAWGVEYRARLYTLDPAYRPEITVLRVSADRL